MQLSSIVDKNLIYIEESKKSKDELIRDMVTNLCRYYGSESEIDNYLQRLRKREMEASTAYSCGISIPHIRVENFSDTQICMCILHHPIIDNNIEIRLVVLVLTNNGSAHLYLNLVSTLLRVAKDEELFSRILSEKHGHSVYHILEHTDLRVYQELTIASIMTPDPITINQNASIKELGDIVGIHKLSYIPVVDDDGCFVGEISALSYLKTGIPDYLLLIDNLHFLRSFDPLNHIVEHESEISVKSLMTSPKEITYPTSSIIKVAFKMVQLQINKITVIDQKKVVGVVTAIDMINKAIRS